MEINKDEVAAVELVAKQLDNSKELSELQSLELVLIGGGCGDVAF